MKHISRRIQRMEESQTFAMALLTKQLQDKGLDVIKLTLGEPDFNTPDHIKEAAKKAIDENETFYTPVQGNDDLVQAIIQKFKTENDIQFQKNEILVSNGAKHTISNIFMTIIQEGDEVIIPVPYWGTYKEIVNLAHGTQIFVEGTFENAFKITAKQLEEKITDKTRAIFLNSPSNPTGITYTKEEMAEIAETVKKNPKIMLVSDEIYEHLNYNGKHESFAQFKEIKDQLIIVNGVSKAYAMTGWRIGYMGAPAWVVSACKKLQGQTTSGASSIAQKAAVAALTVKSDIYAERMDILRKRRDFIAEELKSVPDIKFHIPAATFYIFVDFSAYIGKSFEGKTIKNSMDLSMYLLEKGRVGLVAGGAFGVDTCLRLSFTVDMPIMKEAVKRIKEALAKLN